MNELGSIVNAQNNNLTGYPIVNNVTNRATLVPVKLDTTGVVPRATGAADLNPGIQVQINMDDRDDKSLAVSTTLANQLAPWSSNTKYPPDNLNTFNYSTSVTVYDQKGNDHALSMYFTRVDSSQGTAPGKNDWQVHYVLGDQDITNQVKPATNATGTGVPLVRFNADGTIKTTAVDTTTYAAPAEPVLPATYTSLFLNQNLDGSFPAGIQVPVPVPPPVGAPVGAFYSDPTHYEYFNLTGEFRNYTVPVGTPFDVQDTSLASGALDFKFEIDVGALSTAHPEFNNLFPNNIPIDFTSSTLFGSGYDVNKLTQDGYAYGRLSGVSVSSDGVLRGSYSNGQTKDIAQLVLVDFVSPTGLASLGNNQWGETNASGQPLVGDPGTGNRGVLQSAAVEEANVDLTQELVSLITMQRNYQANAQSIKTQDQILQTLVNLR